MAIRWIQALLGFRRGSYLVPRGQSLVGPFKTLEEARRTLGDKPPPDEPSPEGAPEELWNLRVATTDEVTDALPHALRFNGGKRRHEADEMQARTTAGHLLRCLEMSGFVLMRKPSRVAHWAGLGRTKGASKG